MGDYEAFIRVVDPSLTCFLPGTCGNLVEGLDFHKFLFDNVISKSARSISAHVLNPYIHMLGKDAACVAYTRVTQYIDRAGLPHTQQSEDTVIWLRRNSTWQIIHVHRSVSQDRIEIGV